MKTEAKQWLIAQLAQEAVKEIGQAPPALTFDHPEWAARDLDRQAWVTRMNKAEEALVAAAKAVGLKFALKDEDVPLGFLAKNAEELWAV